MLILTSEEIESCVTCEDMIQGVEEALCLYEAQDFRMPDRLTVDLGDNNSLLLMPCASSRGFSSKIITLFPGNRTGGRPVIDGVVLLNDPRTGAIVALLDGKTVTRQRTGAITGVSVKCFARPDVDSVGLVGCGAQGYYQVQYACVPRDIQRITLFDIDPAAVTALASRLRETFPDKEIETAPCVEDLMRRSDVIITATTARDPVLPDDPALFEGKHIIAIGSFQPDVRECPDSLFSLVERVWIDTDFAKEESGELITPLREGLLREEQLETLGHFIESHRSPERGAHGTTLSKSVGMALYDLTAATRIYYRALEKGIGTEVSMG